MAQSQQSTLNDEALPDADAQMGETFVVQVALPLPLARAFDYCTSRPLDCGAIVSVRFGKQNLVGVIVGNAARQDAAYAVSPIIEDWGDQWRIPANLLELAATVARYYQAPLGMVLAQMLPPRVRRSSGIADRNLRLTPTGLAACAGIASRARRQSALAELLRAAPAKASQLPGLGAWASALARQWVDAGWAEWVGPEPASAAPLLPLNEAQRKVLQELLAPDRSAPRLLQGVTGSGKTEIYVAFADELAREGRQTLMLVPEINLTPQFEERIRHRAPHLRLAVLHSGLPASERAQAWQKAARGEAELILGTRLAIYAPVPRLGAIIVDEEQDASYKQGEGVRYHAREVALFRAAQERVPIVLGSATPSLESYARALSGRYLLATLQERAIEGARLPEVRLVPRDDGGAAILSETLSAAIRARLEAGEQSLLFVNRRGYAPLLRCEACQWEASCRHCSAKLVLHLAAARLCCHHCGYQCATPRACPSCGNLDLLPKGSGTQRLEKELQSRFPQARILRIDRDSTARRGAWTEMLAAIRRGDADILVGTQMLAKGHDFPALTLVAVLGADNAFYSADFRATERLFAQLVQVAGRAGRAQRPGEVLIETAYPQHPLLRAVIKHDFAAGAQLLLAERRAAALPPFTHLALLHAEAPTRERVTEFLQDAHAKALELTQGEQSEIEVFAPVPSPLARRADFERGQMLVQSHSRRQLGAFLTHWRSALPVARSRLRWHFDIDPLDFQ